MKFKLGYFVPEFPGQTHIFFWREIQRLEAMGTDLQILSTQKPPLSISPHSWSDAAKRRTIYLYEKLDPFLVITIAWAACRWKPSAWARCLRSIQNSGLGLKGKFELFLLSIFGARLAVIAQKENLDHIHVHSCANAANVAMFASLLSGIPYSLTLHGKMQDYGPNQAEKWRHARFVIVITQRLFDQARSLLGPALTQKVHIAPMGVNLDTFKRKKKYEVWDGNGPCKLYSVGRLNLCKGHADLIRAVGILRSKGIPAELKIAGEDDIGGSGYHIELQELIDELKLGDHVKLLGAVSEQVIRDGLDLSHIFSLASLDEALGVAIMEAMALEMPVVVSRSGGVGELVDHEKDGILIDPEDSPALARAIEKLLKDPTNALRLAQASRQKIIDQFQDSRSAEMLIRLAQS